MRFLAIVIMALISIPAQAMYLSGSTPVIPPPPPVLPLVILDDDGGGDDDDAADVRMMNTLAVNNVLVPYGYIASDSDPYNASAEKALQNFQGLSYPIYAYQASDLQGADTWSLPVTNTFNPGDIRTNYQSCEIGYRLLLGNATRKVVIAMGGYAKCLDQLLESPANFNGDGLGTGLSLIHNNVSYVIWTAGSWPSGTNDFNLTGGGFAAAEAATQDLLANWPSSVPFYFYGVDQTSTAKTGPLPSSVCVTSASDPYELAFFSWQGASNPCTRFLWTQPTFIYITQGLSSNFQISGANGTATFNSSTTANAWTSTPGPFSYITNVASQASIQGSTCALERWGSSPWC